jgi:hypothetical protein
MIEKSQNLNQMGEEADTPYLGQVSADIASSPTTAND